MKIDDHSIDGDALRPGWVMDAGCKDWKFTCGVLAMERGMKVLAMDPNAAVEAPPDVDARFRREALVGDGRDLVLYVGWSTGEGDRVCREGDRQPSHTERSAWVHAVGMVDLMRREGIDFFELVKLDIEGSEYDVLTNWPGPVARQISVEFHDFDGLVPGDPDAWHAGMLEHLGQWYDVASHERIRRHGLENYWDSLFVLRTSMA